MTFSQASYVSQHNLVTISHIPETLAAKYLEYWWSCDLLASRSENIKKARGSFFHHGSLSFHGDLNPLSIKSVINSCVMPVLLYDCEIWILTERAIHQLESFLGWMIKKALKWPQHLYNTAALIAFGGNLIKQGFLLCLISGDADGVAVSAMHALVGNPDFICIIRECRELEAIQSQVY